MAQATKPKFSEAEDFIDQDNNFLDKVVEEGSESGDLMRQQIRYLKNNGQPSSVLVDIQRHVSWWDKQGKQRMIEVILPNRESNNPKDDEKKKAEQLKLVDGEKALLYFQPTGDIVKKVVDSNFTFTVFDYPHLKGVVMGEGSGLMSKKRKYNCLVDQILKVTNSRDFEQLWRTYQFLDEVDEEGNIIRENLYTKNLKNPPKKSDKPMPQSFGQLDEKQIPMATKDFKRSEMEEATDDTLELEEKSNPSETINV